MGVRGEGGDGIRVTGDGMCVRRNVCEKGWEGGHGMCVRKDGGGTWYVCEKGWRGG